MRLRSHAHLPLFHPPRYQGRGYGAGPAVKEQRTARAGQVAERLHRAYLEGCVGQVYPVLFEQAKDGLYTGHAPNYMEVGVAADGLHNVILDVKITGVDGEILRGELT
jgi:threonylcarbamoyladenosine tRNA methylthiotransferase MtaB